jgi:poly-gamma-glutamate capsule biosynthesis protein CapA/YwtB (metallophosphatase superfamily)
MSTPTRPRPRRLPHRVYVRRRITVGAVAVAVVAGPVWAVAATGGGGGDGGGSAAPEPAAASTTTATTEPPTTTTTRHLGNGNQVTFAFGGDVHFERSIEVRLADDPASVMGLVAPTMTAADLAVVNVETAVTEGGTPAVKPITFRAPTTAWSALVAAGVDVASVANNHGMDYGVDGLEDTLDSAEAAGVPVIGAGMTEDEAYEPFRTTVNGQRIAVIAATQVLDDPLIDEWTAEGDEPGLASAKRVDRLVEEVEAVRADSDTVVVFLHWGVEQLSCPTDAQEDLADALVAAGADIVVGSHAHVLLGAGRLGDAFVAYGLGNFTFMERTAASVHTGVLEVTATGRRIDGYRFLPGVIADGLHQPLDGEDADDAVASWNDLRECTNLVA